MELSKKYDAKSEYMGKDGKPMALEVGTAVKGHPLLHGFEGPSPATGTNQGRVDVPVRSPGEISAGAPGVDKGKAVIAHGVPVCLAQEQIENEGGYNR